MDEEKFYIYCALSRHQGLCLKCNTYYFVMFSVRHVCSYIQFTDDRQSLESSRNLLKVTHELLWNYYGTDSNTSSRIPKPVLLDINLFNIES